MPTDVLSRIAQATRARLKGLKALRPVEELRRLPLYRRPPGNFASALKGGARVIAEIKFASPSEGLLRGNPSASAAVAVAGSYLAAGASALSILTEPEFFRGSPEFLRAVRLAYPAAPLLMKDFFIDSYQFHLARASGADAVLLIAALLQGRLPAMLAGARELGLSALVEVHNEDELIMAAKAGADIIGVNSRNLRTLKTDLDVAHRLARPSRRLRAGVLIAESGISSRRDIDRLSEVGYDAFLVGTALMRKADPGGALEELLQ